MNLDIKKSKPHYVILDGLRGVAAILVVFFHVLEIYSGGDHALQMINHGYLAVDFFFLLSGFVIGYAYDDRWQKMSLLDFFKRRIIRLQPMIIIGSIIGALLFYFQDSPALHWVGISQTPWWRLILITILGCLLIPVGKGGDIRGWNEMYPLNGPAWSLFFEYIANIAYALVLRRVSKMVLGLLVIIAAGFTIHYAFTNEIGDIIGGWAIDDPVQLKIGFIRLSFPFLAGLLLSRTAKLKYIPNAFLISSILLVALLSVPRLGDIPNRIYECLCLMVMFPFIIWLGAGGKVIGAKSSAVCKFLGDISYPVYITHFPLINIYMAWVANNKLSFEESWPYGLLVVVLSIILGYVTMKLFDIPMRNWLKKKFL
ncbi:acyltransferase [Apibacter raozihei]|uniref:acyltransferase family protein n=1 Tax=Apibacter TaxID=1778601 RepID=UPI000FE3718A|nr:MULTISPECIES: acyltransferase [Apibacter]